MFSARKKSVMGGFSLVKRDRPNPLSLDFPSSPTLQQSMPNWVSNVWNVVVAASRSSKEDIFLQIHSFSMATSSRNLSWAVKHQPYITIITTLNYRMINGKENRTFEMPHTSNYSTWSNGIPLTYIMTMNLAHSHWHLKINLPLEVLLYISWSDCCGRVLLLTYLF